MSGTTAAAMQSEERFRLLVESVKDYAILMLDPEGRVTSWNAGAQSIKGYTASEIVGKPFSLFYPEEDVRRGKPKKELDEAAAHGRYEEEGWRVRKDGSRFWASVVITAIRENGKLVGFAKVTRDLTERKRAEEEREAHRRILRELSTPIIRVYEGVLLLPLIGEVDDLRAIQVMESVLSRVVEGRAKVLIIDVAGVPALDTAVAKSLLETTAAARMVGAKTILTGISARAAATMVQLGVDMSAMPTQNELADGIELALSMIGRAISVR